MRNVRWIALQLLLMPLGLFSQVLPSLVNSYTQAPWKLHYPYDMEVDGEGSIWLYGSANDTVPSRIGIIVKFSDHGQTLDWVHEYHDCSLYADIDIDEYGNVHMAATVCDTLGSTGQNYLIRKIDFDGNELWSRIWTGNGWNNLDRIYALCVDGAGNVIATGVSEGENFSGFNWVTVKYDLNGNLIWTAIHAPPDMLNAPFGGIDITTDDADNIYVTGESHDEVNGDFATIKYRPDGTEAWLRREGGFIYSQGNCVRVKDDKVIVGGPYRYPGLDSTDAFVAVYDTTGATFWTTRFNAPHPTLPISINRVEIVSDLVMDEAGNVLVTGTQFYGNGSNNDYMLVKFDSNGETLWHRHYGPGTAWSDARSMFVDEYGSVFVTGMCENTPTGYGEIHTLKYDADGALQWVAPYAPAFWESCMEGIIRWDGADHFYIGSSSNGPATHQLLLLGYSVTTGMSREPDHPVTMVCPNPARDELVVDLASWTGPVEAMLCDAIGRIAMMKTWKGGGVKSQEIGDLAAGTYVLHLTAERRAESVKVIVE